MKISSTFAAWTVFCLLLCATVRTELAVEGQTFEDVSQTPAPGPCGRGETGPHQGSCTVCAAGKFKDTVDDTPCSECPAGKHQRTPGSFACNDCEAGKYKDHAGVNTECDNCEAGKYKVQAGVNVACDTLRGRQVFQRHRSYFSGHVQRMPDRHVRQHHREFLVCRMPS